MNRHEDRDDDYREEDKPEKKGHWEYAGPGCINADDPPTCRYCPDHPIMDRLTPTVYECPKCAYEINLESLEECGDE